MKKFSVPCDFNGTKSPFTIYVGSCKQGRHPVFFQSDWLSKERGGTIPQEVMESLTKLKELSERNGVSFEDLCVYALGTAQQEMADQETTDEDTESDIPDEELEDIEDTESDISDEELEDIEDKDIDNNDENEPDEETSDDNSENIKDEKLAADKSDKKTKTLASDTKNNDKDLQSLNKSNKKINKQNTTD